MLRSDYSLFVKSNCYHSLHIDPLKSYKSFMHTQAEDLPPAAFQRYLRIHVFIYMFMYILKICYAGRVYIGIDYL
jgi:hypothetical protein